MYNWLLRPKINPESAVRTFLLRYSFWLVCLVGIIGLATLRSPPFYGKIDFFLLKGRPWWPVWKALVTNTGNGDDTPVYTDYVTGCILGGVFGKVPVLDVIRHRIPTLYIEDMETNKLPAKRFLNIYLTKEDFTKDFTCVINLIGYESSWVPDETGHWSRRMGRTSEFYNFRSPGKEPNTRVALENFPFQKCVAYFPEENTQKR